MFYNQIMLSCLREMNALAKENRSPSMKLVRLLNQYHSIDLMYGTKEQKDSLRQDLSRIIRQLSPRLPKNLQTKIPNWLDSKEEWEYDRESVYF